MTIVIAEEVQNVIHMGADSATGSPDEVYTYPHLEKVFLHGPYLFGHCGTARIGQILRYCVEPPEPPAAGDLTRFLVHELVPEIRRAVRDAGAVGQGHFLGDKTVILLGCRGRLWCIGADLMVLRLNQVAAIGSGRHRAYAAMHALRAAGVEPVRRRIELALEATAEFTTTVRPPFHFIRGA